MTATGTATARAVPVSVMLGRSAMTSGRSSVGCRRTSVAPTASDVLREGESGRVRTGGGREGVSEGLICRRNDAD